MGEWRPQKKQAEALVQTADEILYGGARGGGKTDAGMAWLLYDIEKPRYRALVIRRNADDLRDWIDRARNMYNPTGAILTGNPAEIKFPSGATIRTGHLKDENAYTKYQGHEYQKILIEELTHIPRENDYEKLLGSCRSTVPGIKPQVFATTNPDGAGYEWVKERFSIPDNPIDSVKTETEDGRTRAFIPAKVEDNPVLVEADPGYIKYLESIKDPDLRRAWRDGSWAGIQIEGAYYREEINKARAEQRITKVPYEQRIPVNTYWDLGVGDDTTILFMQQIGKEWRMIDAYASSGEGLNHYLSVLQQRGYVYGSHFAPHDIEVREFTTGTTRRELAANLGINFQALPALPVDEGINMVRTKFNQLWIDEEKCKDAIRAFANYRKEFDEKHGVYKQKPLHDWASHYSDALRYWAISPEAYQGEIKFSY